VRRQTDERHKAMFEILTAVSKLKRDGPFIVVKAYNLIYNKHHMSMEIKGNGNYLPSVLTFKNCTLCPQCAFMYCVCGPLKKTSQAI